MASLGERIIAKIHYILENKELSEYNRGTVKQIIENYEKYPDQLDLRSICIIERLIGEEILIVPTKQQWRKIKLERLNEISNNL
jgi:hypothetical protein